MTGFVLACALAGGWVNNVKVVSDKTKDVTTLDALLKWMVRSGMSDRQKAVAVWETVNKFRHQDAPPQEHIDSESDVHDPLKTFNVYGYGMCCCASSNIEALARAVGLKARGRIVSHHSVPEVFWGGKWHYLDSSLMCYFAAPGGHVYSVDEMIEIVAKHPEFKPKRATPKTSYPPPFNTCPMADARGIFPAQIHGLHSAWGCFDGKNRGVYEYGYSMGYRALFKLRRGEVLTRNWSHKGLHVNMRGGNAPGCLKMKIDDNQLRYHRQIGDLAPGRVGNGTLLYRVPLAKSDWRSGAWKLDNVARARGIAPAMRGKPAEAVFRMHCPYVFLTGKVRLAGKRASQAASLALLVSTNNALDWTEVWKLDKTGPFQEEVDLSGKVFRRYDYYVKLVIKGSVQVSAIEFENAIQHSQRALPALARGRNVITVSGAPATDTITIAPSAKSSSGGKNEVLSNFHPLLERVSVKGSGAWCTSYGQPGFVTFPVETPGDIYAVRFGGQFRARGSRDGIELLLSFDGGRNWFKAGEAPGPYPGFCKHVEFKQPPRGARKVLVRYKLVQGNNTTGVMGLRVDVDYWDTPDGKPTRTKASDRLKVTYVWKEGGAVRRNVYVARKLPSTYAISCGSRPVMQSIVVELAK